MKKLILTMAAAAAIALPALAQTTTPNRVAVINVQRVLTESSAGKAALEKLRKLQNERQARLKKLDDEIRALDTDLSQRRLSLSPEKIEEMQKQISDRRISLERGAQDAERELQEARDRELQEMEKVIMPLIDEIGKEMGFAAIFNKFESGLIYASPAIEITDTVITRYNQMLAGAAPGGAK
ncbi:MAG TPA: OmpH family outer membrane protein [Thermoanaerobaculia bacterium]|nr:OmpH family outer membrane protein [Thermoanaerobaculia bacterium]